MGKVTIHVDTADKESVKRGMHLMTLIAGTATAGKAAAPAKGKASKKAAEPEEDDEFVDESEISTFNDDDFGSEEEAEEDFGGDDEDMGFEEEEEKPKKGAAKGKDSGIKLEQIIKGFQNMTTKDKKNGQARAKKILDKYKVKSVRNLKQSDYAAVMALLK